MSPHYLVKYLSLYRLATTTDRFLCYFIYAVPNLLEITFSEPSNTKCEAKKGPPLPRADDALIIYTTTNRWRRQPMSYRPTQPAIGLSIHTCLYDQQVLFINGAHRRHIVPYGRYAHALESIKKPTVELLWILQSAVRAFDFSFVDYLRQGGYVFVVVCLIVRLFATLRKDARTDLHGIFGEVWQCAIEQTSKFWWRSGSPSGCRDCFPESSLLGDTESGINRLRCATLQCVTIAVTYVITSPAHNRQPRQTCIGGGMHCLSAYSYIYTSANLILWMMRCSVDDQLRKVMQLRCTFVAVFLSRTL